MFESISKKFKLLNYNYSSIFPIVENEKLLSIFRISHSSCLLVLSFYLFELIPFTHFNEMYKSNFEIYYQGLYCIWISLTILILLGTRFRLVYILNYLLTEELLGGNIGDFMLRIASFWMIFILPCNHYSIRNKYFKIFGLDKDNSSGPANWAVFLLGLNLSFIITIAGVFKFLDPVWYNGLGFYYAYLQPWIHVPWTSFILESKVFVYFMNYLGIIFETLAFFLFIFNRTRIYSIFVMFCFLFLVLFPLRIDPVGPAGLVILVALASLINFEKKYS